MFGYDREQDENRRRQDPHYRLYYVEHEDKVTVVCVQDFDYGDYNDEGFVGYEAYESEQSARLALLGLKALFANS